MPLRRVRRIGEVERALIHDQYRRNGPVWDIVINDIARDERFMNMPDNVQQLYVNAGQRPAARRRIHEYVAREQRNGLLERVNEMQYADRQNAFQREAANLAIRQRIEGDQHENVAGNNGEIDEVPIIQAQNNANENVMFLLEQEEEQEQQPGPDRNEDEQLPAQDIPRAMPIPIPVPGNGGERRPYHALARENAESLNALLTREIPVIIQQLQHTMELMNQLIRRQLDN